MHCAAPVELLPHPDPGRTPVRRLALIGVLVMLLLSPLGSGGQGLWVSVGTTPSRASVGEPVRVNGFVQYLVEGTFLPLFVTEAYFVVHHGTGSRTTPNLLASPFALEWDFLEVSTNFTPLPGDPLFLQIEFVAAYSFLPDGANVFSSRFGCQVQLVDAPRPSLIMVPAPRGGVTLHWPEQFRDWPLESSEDLGQGWTAVPRPVAITDETCSVEWNGTPGVRRFFRLRR